jgi:hypothetical protein
MKWVLSIAIAVLCGGRAFATSWRRCDLVEAVRECPRVCVGVVLEAHAKKSATAAFGADGICTEVSVRVEHGLKGFAASEANGTFTFWVPGGSIGDDVREIPGAPSFRAGDRALLFFFESEGRWWPLWGGVAPIVRGAVIGQRGHTIELARRLEDLEPEIARLAKEERR